MLEAFALPTNASLLAGAAVLVAGFFLAKSGAAIAAVDFLYGGGPVLAEVGRFAAVLYGLR